MLYILIANSAPSCGVPSCWPICCAALLIGCIGYRNAPLLLPTAKARTLCVYIASYREWRYISCIYRAHNPIKLELISKLFPRYTYTIWICFHNFDYIEFVCLLVCKNYSVNNSRQTKQKNRKKLVIQYHNIIDANN